MSHVDTGKDKTAPDTAKSDLLTERKRKRHWSPATDFVVCILEQKNSIMKMFSRQP